MIKDKIKKLMRPVDSLNYGIALSNSIYNTAIRDVLEVLEHNDDDARKETAKEFAEKVKTQALSNCRIINCYELKFIETIIDELLKEYEK